MLQNYSGTVFGSKKGICCQEKNCTWFLLFAALLHTTTKHSQKRVPATGWGKMKLLPFCYLMVRGTGSFEM